MMGRARGLLLVTVVALPAAAPIAAEEPAPARFVGVEVCATCHGQPETGDQYRVWTASMHARTYIVLATGYQAMIDPAARGLVDPGFGRAISERAAELGADTDCMACHAAGSEVGEELRADTFHLEDGVQCETCHGPGSHHVAAHQNPDAAPPGERRLPLSDLEDCLRCHRHKPSHSVLDRHPFVAQQSWQKIAHPMPEP
jgi:hypothetical protein